MTGPLFTRRSLLVAASTASATLACASSASAAAAASTAPSLASLPSAVTFRGIPTAATTQSKESIMMLVSTAENSSLDWRRQYGYIEYDVEGNAAENRGYTAGIIGFTSKTHDMLALVRDYVRVAPRNNPLARFLPALQRVDGTSSTRGLGAPFVTAWRQAARTDPRFRAAQDRMRDRAYFTPAVNLGVRDRVQELGQFAYYDAAVMHGQDGLAEVRRLARLRARTPAAGGNERVYLKAFLDARVQVMRREVAHSDTSRIDAMQRRFLAQGKLTLGLPLAWSVYGDRYSLTAAQVNRYHATGRL
ncbi:chitosanase [Arsenicicoccus piscis]|uniref:Chitosanase n=1 Tax=Arsenicicoccus piscis TaxID=673954 RepID=A0ABQ6HNY9_9MICO|nr:chitosanase [Arsenicicoccus piscis]MCH8628888.1 chitosanase [Arsenicicoccus piscis]GMA20052.1 chitosanase [Arsenicicoccus piscis]